MKDKIHAVNVRLNLYILQILISCNGIVYAKSHPLRYVVEKCLKEVIEDSLNCGYTN